MKHQEYAWIINNRNRIFAQSWQPDHSPKGVINLIHGLGDHTGRYCRWAELFINKGYAFLGMDLPGNGKSDGTRGHIRNFQVLMDLIDLQLNKSDELFPDIPRILYGHSMGGNLVINYTMLKDPPIKALIASAPWLKLVTEPSYLSLLLVKLLLPFFPRLTVNSRNKNEYRSHDPVVVEEAKQDPLMHGKISLKLFDSAYKKGFYALKHVYKINKPFLLMHGSDDKITSCKASEEFVRNTSERTRLKIWEGLYHELHNEKEYEKIFNYIVDWLKEYNL